MDTATSLRAPAICQQCHASFTARVASINVGMGRFCSKACFGLSIRVTPAVAFNRYAERTPDGCWLWSGLRNRDGYGLYRAYAGTGRTRRQIMAHRVSWELHFGPIPAGLFICHRCDTRACVNPTHLFLGTNGDNSRDMVAKARSAFGSRHPKAKLTEEAVIDIRQLVAAGSTQVDAGRKYGVSKTVVNHLVKRHTWTRI